MEMSDQLHARAAFTLGVRALGSYWIGGWVGLRRSGCGGEDKNIPLLLLSGIEARSSTPCPSLFTDWAARASLYTRISRKMSNKMFFFKVIRLNVMYIFSVGWVISKKWTWDSLVSVAARLMVWTTGVRFPSGAGIFPRRRRVHTGSGAQPNFLFSG
jgi:hypothetical protein